MLGIIAGGRLSFHRRPKWKRSIAGPGRKTRGENFDRDRAVESRVFRFVNFAHAARAQRRLNLIGPELGSCRKGRWSARIITFTEPARSSEFDVAQT